MPEQEKKAPQDPKPPDLPKDPDKPDLENPEKGGGKGAEKPGEEVARVRRLIEALSHPPRRDHPEDWKKPDPEEELDLLPEAERGRLAKAALSLQEVTQQPQSWEESIKALQCLKVADTLGGESREAARKLSLTRTRDALASIQAEWAAKKNPEGMGRALTEKMRRLYRLLSLQNSPEGEDLCMQAIVQDEQVVDRLSLDELKREIRGAIAGVEQHPKERVEEGHQDMQKILELFRKLGLREQEARERFQERDGTLFYTCVVDGRQTTWRVEANRRGGGLLFLGTGDTRATVFISESKIFTVLENDELDDLLEEGVKSARSDQEQQREFERFDIPEKDRIAHIRLFPKQYIEASAEQLFESVLLSSALHRRYGDRLHVSSPIFSDRPKQALIAQIEQEYAGGKGIKIFCIDFFSQANGNHLEFEQPLTASDLADIARQFPDCQFSFGAIAFHGVGLITEMKKEMERDPSLKGRILYFREMQPLGPDGSGGRLKSEDEYRKFLSLYNLHFAESLLEQHPFGQSASMAGTAAAATTPSETNFLARGQEIVQTLVRKLDPQAERRQQEEKAREKMGSESLLTQAASNLSRLSTEGLQTITTLVEHGGGDLARALLSSDLRGTGPTLVGDIQGEQVTVEARGGEAQCYLVHGSEKIPFGDKPGEEAFNQARLTKIAKVAGAEYLERPSRVRRELWNHLFKRMSGEHFMTQGEADLTEKVLQPLLRPFITRGDEVRALRHLHFIDASGQPDFRFLTWWAMELRYLAQEVAPQQFLQVLKYDHLHRLAEKWERERTLSLLSFTEMAHLPPVATPQESGPDVATKA